MPFSPENFGDSPKKKSNYSKPSVKDPDILSIRNSKVATNRNESHDQFFRSSTKISKKKTSFWEKNKKAFLMGGGGIALVLLFFWGYYFLNQNSKPPSTLDDISDNLISPVVSFGDHNYQIVNARLSWEQARTIANRENGYLATINSWDEKTFLEALVQESSLDKYWIGGYFNYNVGDFTWVTNEFWNENFENWITRLFHLDNVDDLEVVALDTSSLQWDLLENNDETTAGFIIEWGSLDTSPIPIISSSENEDKVIDDYEISEELRDWINAARALMELFD